MQNVRFLNAGDAALVVEFGHEISEPINARVCALASAIDAIAPPGVVETVPTFRSLMISYDPAATTRRQLIARVTRLIERGLAAPNARPAGATHDIPVLYDGPDLPFVAERANLSIEEVIQRHSARPYLIYMLGFLPGFAYLGGLDERLHTPRLDTPRPRIEPGAVGIGGNQTGIYPLASPGGWRLIGRTPLRPYDPARAQPFLYAAGDRIRFVPINADAFEAIAAGEVV